MFLVKINVLYLYCTYNCTYIVHIITFLVYNYYDCCNNMVHTDKIKDKNIY